MALCHGSRCEPWAIAPTGRSTSLGPFTAYVFPNSAWILVWPRGEMHAAGNRRIACDQAALNESFYEGERYLERLFVVIGAQLGLDVVDDHP